MRIAHDSPRLWSCAISLGSEFTALPLFFQRVLNEELALLHERWSGHIDC
jgi:hypothetical protein